MTNPSSHTWSVLTVTNESNQRARHLEEFDDQNTIQATHDDDGLLKVMKKVVDYVLIDRRTAEPSEPEVHSEVAKRGVWEIVTVFKGMELAVDVLNPILTLATLSGNGVAKTRFNPGKTTDSPAIVETYETKS